MKKLVLLTVGVAIVLVGFMAVLYCLPCKGECCDRHDRCEMKDGDGKCSEHEGCKDGDEKCSDEHHEGCMEGNEKCSGHHEGSGRTGPGSPLSRAVHTALFAASGYAEWPGQTPNGYGGCNSSLLAQSGGSHFG